MTDNENLVFDDTCGISIEEQSEIMSKINRISESNRRQLSETEEIPLKGKKYVLPAKKKGIFFPLSVNIAAVIVLGAGAFLLVFLNGRTDAQIRTGSAVYSLTERALIDEIRRDTAEKIAAKETEIALIASRLSEVDALLFQLAFGSRELTAEQAAEHERLLSQQNFFREELAALHNERTLILADSRIREAALRAQLEERTRENAASRQEIRELQGAIAELERLAGERERIEALADFVYAAASAGGGSNNAPQGRDNLLSERNAQLENTIAQMQRTIDAFSSGGTGQAARLAELEETLSGLRLSINALETSVSEKDRTISSLEGENALLARAAAENENLIGDLLAQNSAQEQEINSLNEQLNNIRLVLQALQELSN